MSVNIVAYKKIAGELKNTNVALVAVSKTKPVEEILELYNLGQRDFGENYVQELIEKCGQLPKDIRWHFIGHLQSNKVKHIAPFISLIQSADSKKLLIEINRQAQKNNRIIDCLLQMHIAREDTKFGLDENELKEIMHINLSELRNIRIAGLMGMASLTNDPNTIKNEFQYLKKLFDKYFQSSTGDPRRNNGAGQYQSPILSMGMSSDYEIAVQEGSNMVRIGSLLFGSRN